MIAAIPKPITGQQSRGVAVKYHLHRANLDTTILAGSAVLLTGGLYPPFESCPNRNLFQQFFGIKFIHDSHTHVRAILTYKFARCFGLVGRFSTAYLTRSTNLDLTLLYLAAHWLGSLSKSTLILYTFAMLTARCFHPINSQRVQLQSRHLSAERFALVFHQRNAGFRHTPTMASCVQCAN
jgi:hypothetical protein